MDQAWKVLELEKNYEPGLESIRAAKTMDQAWKVSDLLKLWTRPGKYQTY